jgi:hypothetical protein
MDVLLQCGHLSHADPPAWFAPCSHCNSNVRIQAFECRVWTVNCWMKYCRFRNIQVDSKDFGAVRAGLHRKNTNHMQINIDYIIPQKVKDEMRAIYGRTVKLFIQDTMDAVSWPEHRTFEIPINDDDEKVPFLWQELREPT